MSDDDMKYTDEIADKLDNTANTLLKRTPSWAVALVSILLTLFGCIGLFLYANSETILKWQSQSLDLEHMKVAHDRCHEEMIQLKLEIVELRKRDDEQRREIDSLKIRLSNN